MTARLEEIAAILKVIDSSACEELILETPDLKLVVRRRGTSGAGPAPAPTPATDNPPAAPAAPAPLAPSSSKSVSSASAPPPPPSPTEASGSEAAGRIVVRAPMVGTFYRASAPGAPPFVEVGSVVEAGAPLCMIEVMKLFTTITAERPGRIVRVAAADGELVEYGRTLFVIEPVS